MSADDGRFVCDEGHEHKCECRCHVCITAGTAVGGAMVEIYGEHYWCCRCWYDELGHVEDVLTTRDDLDTLAMRTHFTDLLAVIAKKAA